MSGCLHMCIVDKPVVFDGKLRGDLLFLLITLDNMCDIEKMEFEKIAIYCRCRGDGSSEHVQSQQHFKISIYWKLLPAFNFDIDS